MKRNCDFLRIFAVLFVTIAVLLIAPVTTYAEESMQVRVGLRRSLANRETIILTNTNILVGYGDNGAFRQTGQLHAAGGFTVRNLSNGIVLTSAGQTLHTFPTGQPAWITATDGNFITMAGYSFRGVVEFSPAAGRLNIVNVLDMEEYLLGVLPSEMSPSFHAEALKAQAVAARTYTFNQMLRGTHSATNFDICDTTCCQVYRGAGTENANASAAVWATTGLMLFYNDMPILASYFSSSGGATENSEDVWWEALPYLRSVNEIVEHNPMVWERTFTWAQLTTAAANQNAGIGQVTGVSISRLAPSGRVMNLTFHGASGDWTALREVTIRNFFSPIGGTLPSRNFSIVGAEHTTPQVSTTNGHNDFEAPLNTMQAVNSRGAVSTVHMGYIYDGTTTRRIDSTATRASGGNGITIRGSGWGHGVGMSQMGAEGMARAGFTFDEILHHYYTGVELRTHGQ